MCERKRKKEQKKGNLKKHGKINEKGAKAKAEKDA
jgi:hypothetical protein